MSKLFTRTNSKFIRKYGSLSEVSLPDHRALVIEKFGDPLENISLKISKPYEVLPEKLGPKQILVEHLTASVNPADIMLIQGLYGVKPKLPAIVGNEGVTRVKSVGSEVKHLQPGDLSFGISTLGYWQSYSIQDAKEFLKIDNDLNPVVAAQLKVNPPTAYRMIKDYQNLKPGDVIIQNGANSAVGVYVIQLAKHWGFKTINVIRDSPIKPSVMKELKDFGADYVITEDELKNVEIMTPILNQIGKPKLLLNCVSGKNGLNCMRHLDFDGTCVTYGFMSRQPGIYGSQVIFKRHTIRSFWMQLWYNDQYKQNKNSETISMLNKLSDMFKQGTLKPKPSTLIKFEDRNKAFSGSNNTKYIFSI